MMDDPNHTCAQIEELAERHLHLVDGKLQNLTGMRVTLARYLAECTGEDVPRCAVLDGLKESA